MNIHQELLCQEGHARQLYSIAFQPVCMFVCVCVRERERERDCCIFVSLGWCVCMCVRKRERNKEREGFLGACASLPHCGLCVSCVCVCVLCVCVYAWVCFVSVFSGLNNCETPLYVGKRALCFCKRALCFCKRALCFRKRALCFCKRALCFCKRALHVGKRALCFCIRAQCLRKPHGTLFECGGCRTRPLKSSEYQPRLTQIGENLKVL